jgi:polysaccharide biosynthesis/export protein
MMVACASVLAGGLRGPLGAQEKPKPQPAEISGETIQDYNQRLKRLERMADKQGAFRTHDEYRMGAGDLLEVSVFEAPELGRTVRVSETGEISLPLLGVVRASGLTPRQEEGLLEELLRRSYMKDPHVTVFVKEMQSHAVSVFGAVRRAGVFQIRGAKTLLEMLSMAEGLADDAGDTVLVVRPSIGAEDNQPVDSADAATVPVSFAEHAESDAAAGGRVEEIPLKNLLESGDARLNVLVFPGDLVKVPRAGIVYVVGEVKRPGGFQLKGNENISVLQAIALAEGLTGTSAKSKARIIRTDQATGKRTEIAIHLGKVFAGKLPDPTLEPRDILFVPKSASRSALYRGLEAAVSVGTGLAVYRR